MKVRWALERVDDPVEPEGSVYLVLVDREGEKVMGPSIYYSEDAAKTAAQRSSEIEDELVWKSAPEAWQPDTYLVSNFYEDEGWQ